jgi:hypothetical protein
MWINSVDLKEECLNSDKDSEEDRTARICQEHSITLIIIIYN